MEFEWDTPAAVISGVIFLVFMFFIWKLSFGGSLVWETVPASSKIIMSVVGFPLFYMIALKMMER